MPLLLIALATRAKLEYKMGLEMPVRNFMKRIAAFLLLSILIAAGSTPLQAQTMSPRESARQSRKASKKQQKMLRRANKKQRKASKKYQKAQRKQIKKENRDLANKQGTVFR
jgi:hypothetical protein